MDTDAAAGVTAAVPVLRHTLLKEFADGDLGLRIVVAAADVSAFWTWFPESGEAAFLACETGAIEVTRDVLLGEYRDGAISVRVLIHPKDKEAFRRLWPHPNMPAILAREEPARGRQAMLDATLEDPPRFGPQARVLRIHVAFMGNPKVWAAVGSDNDYLAWVRTMPCACCKWQPRWEMDVFVQCEAAHVRRVGEGFGTAYKAPSYSAIPLCHRCHKLQHDHGEGEIGGREWVDRTRLKHVVDWVWETLKTELGYAHWNLVPPETLLAWAREHDLEKALPECYRVDAN